MASHLLRGCTRISVSAGPTVFNQSPSANQQSQHSLQLFPAPNQRRGYSSGGDGSRDYSSSRSMEDQRSFRNFRQHRSGAIGNLRVRGADLLKLPEVNKGTAFTLEERMQLGIHGLLPPTFISQREQLERIKLVLDGKSSDLEKHIYLISLQERIEKLFFRVLRDDIEKMLPLVYTPTVGQACLNFGLIYRKPKGLFISIHDRGHVNEIIANWPHDNVKAIVVTDGERILGLGDLGVSGMGIPIGKLALYTALAGIPPGQCLPVMIDVGTNNEKNLSDPLYMGLKINRVRGEEYDSLVDEFMRAVVKRWGNDTLIQFEDFANQNAYRLLQKYRGRYCMFNDDIQGTAAVALAGVYASQRVTKKSLKDYKFFFQGAGSASTGIANLLLAALIAEGQTVEEACAQVYMFDLDGLLVKGRPRGSFSSQNEKFAKDEQEHGCKWTDDLSEAVDMVKPNTLIGAAGVGGVFTADILRSLAQNHKTPVVFALSNPTSCAECTAEDAYKHTEGRAVFASGSPFSPVDLPDGRTLIPSQGNNAYIFPGIALAVTQFDINHLPDVYFLKAAQFLADQTSECDISQGRLYPPMTSILDVSVAMAAHLGELAYSENHAQLYPEPEDKRLHILQNIYQTDYDDMRPTVYTWPHFQ